MTVERMLPVSLPPSPFVRQFAEHLPSNDPLIVLDAGACEGRNSMYLAQKGHRVVALTKEINEAVAGAGAAETLLQARATECKFVAGDIRQLPFSSARFDVVVANEVFHQMTRYQARAALAGLHAVTKPGGVHAVSGYVVNPREANATNRAHCFYPNELLHIYTDAGWQIQVYSEDSFAAEELSGRQIVHSLARIIATR